jgi:hypothetical protein
MRSEMMRRCAHERTEERTKPPVCVAVDHGKGKMGLVRKGVDALVGPPAGECVLLREPARQEINKIK